MISRPSHMVYIILAPVGAVFMTTMNVLTVIIFIKKFRLQSFSLILIVNICLCDIFVCMFSNFFYIVNLINPVYNWTTGDAGCKMFKMVTMTTNVAQIFSLCAINADRLRRLTNISTKQWSRFLAFQILVVIWLVSVSLTLPRLFLFKEAVVKRSLPHLNGTTIISINCKPVDVEASWYVASSAGLFVMAYALPTLYVLYTTIRAQLFMWRRRRQIHLANIKSRVLKMNHTLSLTFNLTAAMFLVVWSPFFILSIIDLKDNTVKRQSLKSLNFSLRCTLLIIGGAKPLIYFICLKRFREALKCNGLFRSGRSVHANSSSLGTRTETGITQSSKIARKCETAEPVYICEIDERALSRFNSSSQC